MKKLLLVAATLCLITILALLLNLGRITVYGVNTWGPALIKTDIRLGSVDIGFFDGQVTLTDIYVGNPQGFSLPKLLSAGTVFMSFDCRSILSNPLIIDQIAIEAPDIAYERIGRTDNFKTLLQNMGLPAEAAQSAGADTAKAAPAKGKHKGRKLIIRNLVIRQARLTAIVSSAGSKALSLTLPEMHLKNIGGSSGAQSEEVTRQALAALYDRILSFSGPVNKISGPADTASQSAGGGGFRKGVDRFSEGMKKLFGK